MLGPAVGGSRLFSKLRRAAAALGLTSVGVLGLPGAPPAPPVAPVRDTAIVVGGAGSEAKADGWSGVVAVPDGTESVALAWDGSPSGALRLRSRTAGGAWSGWVDLQGDATHADDDAAPDRTVVGPVFVADADEVEISVEAGTLAGLTVHALRVDEAPAARGAALGSSPAAAAIAQPGIVPRSSWGAAPWNCSSPPSATRVRFAVLHHTVTTNDYSSAQADDEIRAVQYVHQNLQGYCDIAYNFVVDRFGRTWEGRDGGVDRGIIGGHSKGFNTGSVGVVLLGQHQRGASPPAASVTSAARTAVVQLLRWKFAHHGVDARARAALTSQCDTSTGPCRFPAGQQVALPTIVGHRDVQLTACPGDLAQPIVAAIRGEVADAVNASGPFHPLPGWLPEDEGTPVLTVDAWGGVHPAGTAASVPASAFWPGQRFARGVGGTAAGGWVVDLHGGLHAYGSAARMPSPLYQPGHDVARGVAALPGLTGGYILRGNGGLYAFGLAPPVPRGALWPGQDHARDLTLIPSGLGGWRLDAYGGLHPFGAAPPVQGTGYWPGWRIARAIAANPDGPGGWVLDGFGGLHPFGGAPRVSGNPGYRSADVFRDLVMVSSTAGYAIDTDGVPWPIGDAEPVIPQLTSFGARLGLGIVAG